MHQQRWGQKTRQDDTDSGRAIILAAARDCYAEKGIAGTTIDDIARHARISRRTVYRYFDNKGAIIQAVVDEQALEFLREMAFRLKPAQGDFAGLLKGIILYVVTNGPRAPGHELLLGSPNANETSAMYLSSPAIFDYWDAMLRPPFERAQATGAVTRRLDFNDLMMWTGRVIFSFIQFPSDQKTLSRLIDRFVLTALQTD